MAITTLGWAQLAACRGTERALFFPPDVTERKEERQAREQRAKRICAGCAVRDECLTAALERREAHGVWGGLTELERRSLLQP